MSICSLCMQPQWRQDIHWYDNYTTPLPLTLVTVEINPRDSPTVQEIHVWYMYAFHVHVYMYGTCTHSMYMYTCMVQGRYEWIEKNIE